MSAPSRILIVEDEPLISMMLEDFIDLLGKQVAGSADCVSAALQLVETADVDAAIVDVNLRGGEKSWPVIDALAASNIPFLIATGGSDDSVAPEHRARPVLQKPYTMDGVGKALDAL